MFSVCDFAVQTENPVSEGRKKYVFVSICCMYIRPCFLPFRPIWRWTLKVDYILTHQHLWAIPWFCGSFIALFRLEQYALCITMLVTCDSSLKTLEAFHEEVNDKNWRHKEKAWRHSEHNKSYESAKCLAFFSFSFTTFRVLLKAPKHMCMFRSAAYKTM